MSKLSDALIRRLGGLPPAELQAQVQQQIERALSSAGEVAALIGGSSLAQPAANVAGYSDVGKQLRALTLTPWVYKCVDMIAKSVATTELWVEVAGDKADDHPLTELLAHPNPFQTASEFKQALAAYYTATGNAFIYVDFNSLGEPIELWVIRPEFVEIIPDPVNYVAGYRVRNSEGRETFFPAERVIHWRTWNPYNDYWGLSPIQALAYTIEGNAGARRYTEAFYRNNARISGALVSDNVLPPAEIARLKALWETEYKGPGNAWKMAFLFGGLKYQQFGVSQNDMQIIEQMALDKEDILGAFGIPLGIISENATEANATVALNVYATWTIYPMLTALTEKLSKCLGMLYGDDVKVVADDVRPQDKAYRLQLLATVSNGVIGPDGLRVPVITPNEARRDWLQYGPLEELEPEMQFPEPEPEPEPTPPETQPVVVVPTPAVEAAERAYNGRIGYSDEAERQAREGWSEAALNGMERDLHRPTELHWHVSDDESAALDDWRAAVLGNLTRGIGPSSVGPPAIAATLDPLLRECISDLLAGAETAEEIEDAFKAPFAETPYP